MSRGALALMQDTDSSKSSSRLASSGVRVSHPSDEFEVEAERVADTVSRGGRVAGWSLPSSRFGGAHRQAASALSLVRPAQKSTEQLRAGNAKTSATDQAKCHEGLHAQGTAVAEAREKEGMLARRKAETAAPVATGSAEVDGVMRSPGQALDASTRRDMESQMGYDFGSVRLHTDSRAGESAQSLNAQAYTVGSNVVFGPGRYAPQSSEGRRLLAHELTHVVQQTRAPQQTHAGPHLAVRSAPKHVQRLLGVDFADAKKWLFSKLRDIPGYPLLCVVAGKDLISGAMVKRDATTLTKAVLEVVPGGQAIYEKLQKAKGALETAFDWLKKKIFDLNFTEEYFADLIKRTIAAAHPINFGSVGRAKRVVGEPIGKLKDLATEIAKKVLEFIFQAAIDAFGPTGKKVWAFFQRVGGVISKIAANPIGFAKNLFGAVVQGFKNFGLHILSHLGEGLKTWIFNELHAKGVEMPTEFSFGAMLKLLLEVLGLTWKQKRELFVKKLGEPMVYFFETSVKVFTRIKEEGFLAVKQMIVEKAASVYQGLVNGLKNWVAEQIVKRGVEMVAKLSNPAGELIAAVESIYNTIEFLIDKASQLVDLINTVVNALNDIADGNTGPAAKKVEGSLASTIPLLLSFMAGQLGLSGIGASIRKIIDDIRRPLNNVIEKVLDVVIEGSMGAWEAGKKAFKDKLSSLKQWWTKPKEFKYGEEEHEVTVEGEGQHPEVFIHSNKTPLEHFLNDVKATPAQKRAILKDASELHWRQGELQKPSDDENGSKAYERLRTKLGNLKAREAPPAQIKYVGGTDKFGGGLEADAFVTANRKVGSEPHGRDPAIWEDLGPKLRSDKSYVRGHLISMRLGGEGIWENMMPITNAVNQRMNSQVESKLKSGIANTSRAYHYNVKASYSDNELQPLSSKPSSVERQARAKAAEARLLSLSWTVKPAAYNNKTWGDATGADANELLDSEGNKMPSTVAQGNFTPPTVA